jgi:hypothetical protein
MAKSTRKKPSGHVAAGGAFGNKVVQKPVKTGAANRAKSPGAVNQLGNHLGNPSAIQKLDAGPALASQLGNSLAPKVTQGPGGSRTVQKSGSQAQHGPSAGGPKPESRDIFADFPPTK